MMKGQIAGLMRQAQQMQENMKKAQEQLADILVEGAAGGGLGVNLRFHGDRVHQWVPPR